MKDEIDRLAAMGAEMLGRAVLEVEAETLTALMPKIDAGADDEWKAKTMAVVEALEDRELLEAVAQGMGTHQAGLVLMVEGQTNSHPLLSPLWVGLRPEVFDVLISTASVKQLQIMQHEAAYEPLQSRLLDLAERHREREQSFDKEIRQLAQEITGITNNSLTQAMLQDIRDGLENLRERIDEASHKLDKALAIAWNSDRADLVDTYTTLKERFHRDAVYGVGFPLNGPEAASGLYAELQNKLERPFMVSHDPEENGFLEGNAPGAEALARLSVWYLKDYWEIGLLPGLTDKDVAEIQAIRRLSDEETVHRETMRQQALGRLADIGLTTVKDFRDKEIFSKQMLIDYVANQN